MDFVIFETNIHRISMDVQFVIIDWLGEKFPVFHDCKDSSIPRLVRESRVRG